MTEKSKNLNVKTQNSTLQSNQVIQEKSESDKAFLERTNVKSILNNLLDSLYHHQPDEPLKYILNYFENLSNEGDPVKVAHDRLKSISHNSVVFDDCLLQIYESFLKSANSNIDSSTNKKAAKMKLADLFNKLIELLTSEINPDIQKNLLAKLKKREFEAFSFNYFKSSIKIIFLFKEFLNESILLYNDLDMYSNGDKVNKLASEVLMDQLKNSLVVISSKTTLNSQIALQSLYELSPKGLSSTLGEKHSKILHNREIISLDDFLKIVSKNFMEYVRI